MYNGDRARHMMVISNLASRADKLYQLQSYAAYAIFVLWNVIFKRYSKGNMSHRTVTQNERIQLH